jgi:Spy/CpxP family protein refolding chaperone
MEISMMKKIVYPGIVLSALVGLSLLMAHPADAGTLSDSDIKNMSMLEKMRAKMYFRSHSFEFPDSFSAHHPGPYWILQKSTDFNLTDAQIKQEEELKMGMARNTLEDEAVLKQAYETYAADAAKPDPVIEQIKRDIEAIGKAQTDLATEMIDYHVKGYALLTPEQKMIYQNLVK